MRDSPQRQRERGKNMPSKPRQGQNERGAQGKLPAFRGLKGGRRPTAQGL